MGSKSYNEHLERRKEIDSYKGVKKKLKSFLLSHTFYSADDFLSSWFYIYKFVDLVKC
jgi:hypothetical protein